MIHYRLIIYFFFLFSFSSSVFAVGGDYWVASRTGVKFSSSSAACSSMSYGLGSKILDIPLTYSCTNAQNVGLASTYKGSCPDGYSMTSGSCQPDSPIVETDLDRCKNHNTGFDSTFGGGSQTDAQGLIPYGDTQICMPPAAPMSSPSKGCLMNFDRNMAWKKADGSWMTSGLASTTTPQVCDIGSGQNPQENPSNCPSGYSKSKYADVCVPNEKPVTPTPCPAGYSESQYVPGVCVPSPTDAKPDPFNPDPKNPGGPGPYPKNADGSCNPGYIPDGGSCYKDPKPPNPDPTDPKQPDSNGACPVGYSKSGSMCTKDSFPADSNGSCPIGYSKNSGNSCLKDSASTSCQTNYEKDSSGKCVPKSCVPDSNFPEKCLACEKDALNPNVCKTGSGGTCVPDPALPDKCKGDSTKNTFGGTCASGFSCEGDVIQCAIAKEQHLTNCKLLEPDKDQNSLFNKAVAGTDGFSTDKMKESAEKVSISSFDQNGFGWSRSCPADPSFNLSFAQAEFSIPFSRVCPLLSILSNSGVGITLLGALVWVLGGRNNRS